MSEPGGFVRGTADGQFQHFLSNQHAMLCGFVAGYLIERGLEVVPERVDGDYTDVLVIKVPVGAGDEVLAMRHPSALSRDVRIRVLYAPEQ